MIAFRKWIRIIGYLASVFLFSVLAIVFFGLVMHDIVPETKIVKIESKAEAKSVDLWRVSKDGLKRYRLTAVFMEKTKKDMVILTKARLWYYKKDNPTVFLKSDRVFIDVDNNVDAEGNVYLERNDLRVYTKSAKWNNRDNILKGSSSFRGHSKKLSFLGKSFVYYPDKDKFLAFGVNACLK